MAVFVDLEDDDVDLPQPGHNGIKPLWPGSVAAPESQVVKEDGNKNGNDQVSADHHDREEAAHESAVDEISYSMTVALGCYP